MIERLVFFFDSDVKPWETDLEAIRSALRRLVTMGIECEEMDTNRMNEQELEPWRDQATITAVFRHQAIRQAFGSRGQGGLPYFGRQVPALLVYGRDEARPVAVYPHAETRGDKRADFTIEGYLEELVGSHERG